jgi:hypothetical protein
MVQDSAKVNRDRTYSKNLGQSQYNYVYSTSSALGYSNYHNKSTNYPYQLNKISQSIDRNDFNNELRQFDDKYKTLIN